MEKEFLLIECSECMKMVSDVCRGKCYVCLDKKCSKCNAETEFKVYGICIKCSLIKLLNDFHSKCQGGKDELVKEMQEGIKYIVSTRKKLKNNI